jgi:HAD superfamily hydrolase (TIGR01509 family)
MTEKIEAVLFDIGGVIIRTEDPGPRERLARRFGLDRAGIDRLVFGSPAAQAAERGETDEAVVWMHVQRELDLSAEQLSQFQAEFWAGDRADPSLIHLLFHLRSRCRTGLLTNSWLRDPLPLFWTRFSFGEEEVRAALDVAVSSARIGIQKPAAGIYKAALAELEARPEATVFVDDFMHNIDAARALGMHAIHFVTATQARRDLLALLDR